MLDAPPIMVTEIARGALRFSEFVLVPDSVGRRCERLPGLGDVPWFEFTSDRVCEVPSPETRRLDLTEKSDVYGAPEMKVRTPQAFERGDAASRLVAARAEDAEARVAPFDAVSFELAAPWTDRRGRPWW